MKVYRLLRNNKELGPYNVEELKSLNLKAYDLIWVDGKSASWRYPGEIEELQSFAPPVEEQPFDRFFKKNDTKKTVKEVAPAKPVAEPAEIKKEKPRIRVKAEWSVAKEEPVNVIERPEPKPQVTKKEENIFAKTNAPASTEPSKDNFGWQEAFDDWKKEKPVVPKKSVATVTEKPAVSKRNNNYVYEAEMLEEDPAKTALNTYYDKRVKLDNSKPHVSKNSFRHYINYITPIIFILVIGAFAVYMNRDKSEATVKSNGEPQTNSTAAKDQTTANTDQPGLADLSDENVNTQLSDNNSDVRPSTSGNTKDVNADNNKNEVAASNNNTQKVTPPVITPNKNEVVNKTTQPKTGAGNPVTANSKNEPVNKQPVTKNTTLPATENSTNNIVNNQPTSTVDNKATTAAAPVEKPVTEKKAPATIGSYVQMQTVTQTEGNKRLQVRNISDTKLDLVVVDIQYYDANNKFAKGESIYLHNIPAGKNMLVNTPDDKMASRITAKVSLVSSDEKGVYLVGE